MHTGRGQGEPARNKSRPEVTSRLGCLRKHMGSQVVRQCSSPALLHTQSSGPVLRGALSTSCHHSQLWPRAPAHRGQWQVPHRGWGILPARAAPWVYRWK